MFDVLDIGASGLKAQQSRMNVIAANILNAHTTRNARGEVSPYQRRVAVFASGAAAGSDKPGVHALVRTDNSPGPQRYEPGHPDAGPDGYVRYPNVDLSIEYVNALEASRAFEASVTMMETTKAMLNASLRLIA